MERTDLIPAEDFCMHHHISYSFIATLQEAGLIEITTVEERQFLPADYMNEIERLVRLHTDLDINPEGVEAIAHLLQRMREMQQELHTLRQRLKLYE
jgi:hypothetical protein